MNNNCITHERFLLLNNIGDSAKITSKLCFAITLRGTRAASRLLILRLRTGRNLSSSNHRSDVRLTQNSPIVSVFFDRNYFPQFYLSQMLTLLSGKKLHTVAENLSSFHQDLNLIIITIRIYTAKSRPSIPKCQICLFCHISFLVSASDEVCHLVLWVASPTPHPQPGGPGNL